MPQMFPLSWLILFILVVTIYYNVLIKLYFCGVASFSPNHDPVLRQHSSIKWLW